MRLHENLEPGLICAAWLTTEDKHQACSNSICSWASLPPAEEKEKRYKREALKYQIQQSKKRFEKTKAMLKDGEDKKRALEKERNIEIIEPEQIKEFICSFEYGDYILDSHLSHIFNITTQEIRRII